VLSSACAVIPARHYAGPDNVITLLKKYETRTAGGLLTTPELVSKALGFGKGVTEVDGMPALEKSWCMSEKYDMNSIEQTIAEYCQRKGGSYKNKNWCTVESPGVEKPIFYAESGGSVSVINRHSRDVESLRCTGRSDPAYVYAVSGQGQDPGEWLEVAHSRLGYRARSQQLQYNKLQRELDRLELSSAQHEYEDMVHRVRSAALGADICSNSSRLGPNIYVEGQIETIKTNRLKVAVIKAGRIIAPGIFSPLSKKELPDSVWDSIGNWYICE